MNIQMLKDIFESSGREKQKKVTVETEQKTEMEYTIDLEKAVKYILQKEYFSEFEVIDGLKRHPQGIDFYTWLYRRGIISNWQYRDIMKQLKRL